MKKNKIFYKIFVALVLCSIVFSLCIVTASADAPTIGSGSASADDKTFYKADSPNHGLPIDVSLIGMKSLPNTLEVPTTYKTNPLILDNFGVTYAPQFMGANFVGDQYARNEYGSLPEYDNWRANNPVPRVYAYYDYLDRGNSTSWGDESVSYRYSAIGLPLMLTRYLDSAGVSVNSAFNSYQTYLSGVIGNGILYDGTNLSSQAAYSMQYTIMTEDLANTDYSPAYLENIVLTEVMQSYELYYYVSVTGANVSSSGYETVSRLYTSEDSLLDPLFDYISITTSSDSNTVSSSRLAYCYESASSAINATMVRFDFNEFFNTATSFDVVTSFYINFGLRPTNSSNAPFNSYVSAFGNYPILSANIEYQDVSPNTYVNTQNNYSNFLLNTLSGDVVLGNDFSLVTWIGSAIGSIFSADLIGTISLGDILYLVFGIGFLFVVIKFFAGG